MLTAAPVEIVLEILSFIPLRQLQRLQGLSRDWKAFFAENEEAIYHSAAILHGFVSSHTSLSQSKAAHVPWLLRVHTWKDLCKKHYAMEGRWEGKGAVRCAAVGSAGETIHRFKIDTEQRTVITTYFGGGLRVSGIDEDEALWSLHRTTVHAWAHCEYDGGFLVFTRIGEAMEVWRRKRDANNDPSSSVLRTDFQQQRANKFAWQSPASLSQDDRGAFVPWTVIVPPASVRALRLVFPLLLVASYESQEAYLYDVVTGKLTQTLSLRRSPDRPVDINYVELGARHIFVCTEHDVVIIPRNAALHSQNGAWKFPSAVDDFDGLYAEKTYTLNHLIGDGDLSDMEDATLEVRPLEGPTLKASKPIQQPRVRSFTAVHVSPCGSHFVATDMRGCLYLCRDFEQAIRKALPLSRCVTILDLSYPITYLALDEDKRVGLHVHDRGIFIVPFVSADASPVNTLDLCPLASHPTILHATRVGRYDNSPCIQLTRTELWTKKRVGTALGVGPGTNELLYLDFTKPSDQAGELSRVEDKSDLNVVDI